MCTARSRRPSATRFLVLLKLSISSLNSRMYRCASRNVNEQKLGHWTMTGSRPEITGARRSFNGYLHSFDQGGIQSVDGIA